MVHDPWLFICKNQKLKSYMDILGMYASCAVSWTSIFIKTAKYMSYCSWENLFLQGEFFQFFCLGVINLATSISIAKRGKH